MKIEISEDLKELIPNFLDNRISDIKKFDEFLKEEKLQELAHLAHSFKGVTGSYEFDDLSVMSKNLEIFIEERKLKDASIIINKMKEYVKQIEIVYTKEDE